MKIQHQFTREELEACNAPSYKEDEVLTSTVIHPAILIDHNTTMPWESKDYLLKEIEIGFAERAGFLFQMGKHLILNESDQKFIDFYIKYSILKKFNMINEI